MSAPDFPNSDMARAVLFAPSCMIENRSAMSTSTSSLSRIAPLASLSMLSRASAQRLARARGRRLHHARRQPLQARGQVSMEAPGSGGVLQPLGVRRRRRPSGPSSIWSAASIGPSPPPTGHRGGGQTAPMAAPVARPPWPAAQLALDRLRPLLSSAVSAEGVCRGPMIDLPLMIHGPRSPSNRKRRWREVTTTARRKVLGWHAHARGARTTKKALAT